MTTVRPFATFELWWLRKMENARKTITRDNSDELYRTRQRRCVGRIPTAGVIKDLRVPSSVRFTAPCRRDLPYHRHLRGNRVNKNSDSIEERFLAHRSRSADGLLHAHGLGVSADRGRGKSGRSTRASPPEGLWAFPRSIGLAAVVAGRTYDLPAVVATVAISIALAPGKQIGHDIGRRIAGVVQAGQLETGLDGVEQGKVGVEDVALHALNAVVGVHGQHHLVRGLRHAVVVFVPHDDDGVVAILPGGGLVNGGDEKLNRDVAAIHQSGVKAEQRAVVAGVRLADRAGIAATMLVVALVWRDERKCGNVTGTEIGEKAILALKIGHIVQAEIRVCALLNVLKIREGIVLDRVESHQVRLRLAFPRKSGGKVGEIGKKAVGSVDAIGSGGRQAFLIALPGAARRNELVGDGLADGIGIRYVEKRAVDVDIARRPGCFVRSVNGGRGRISACSVNRADGSCRAFQRYASGSKVGRAEGVVPVRRILVAHADIRPTNDFET